MAGGNGIALGRARRLVVLHRADARDDPTEEYDWIAVAVAAAVLLLLPLVEDFANRGPGSSAAWSGWPAGSRPRSAPLGAEPAGCRQVHGPRPRSCTPTWSSTAPARTSCCGGSRPRPGELGEIAIMQIAPEQGAFMTLLVRAIGARRALELGTFTGYSAICIARGLPDGGRLVSCDVNEEWAGIARRYFEAGRAGRADRDPARPGARHAARDARATSRSTSPSSTPTRPATRTTTRRRCACFAPAAWR